jgi:enoyl-CoA hydratase/carnithine racemase
LPFASIEVRVDQNVGIAFVTIHNERKLNTLNSALLEEIALAFEGLAGDETLRTAVLSGAGERAFIGGADVVEMAQLDAISARAFIGRVHRCCDALRDAPFPVIARMMGYTLGAGLELAAACDLRIAAETAIFGMPEVKLGIPSVVEAALLPTLIGWGRTRRLLLLGETITAAEAAAWGLVEMVVPAGDLNGAVQSWTASILQAGPRAVRLQKALIRRWEELPLSEAVRAGIDAFCSAWETDEPNRMMKGFLARRKR